jgi:DNA-binding transcriptional MerR regulator
MTLSEIAEASSIPARTIRFYIARGLLNGPVKGGRGAEYTAEHVAVLEQIKRLQQAGHTLSEIVGMLRGHSGNEAPAVSPTAWHQYAIADDVVVWVKSDAAPWRTKQIRTALEDFARRAQLPKNGRERE